MLKQSEGVHYMEWKVGAPEAAMLFVHGMGAHAERFAELSARLNSEKISCYSVALHGFGELSGTKQGHVDSIRVYHMTLAAMKEMIKKENPGVPVFMLGESMGGLIATVHAIGYDRDFAGLIVTVPAYKDLLKISLLEKAAVFMESVFAPDTAHRMPFTSEELTRDLGVLEKLKADPREHRFASAALLKDLFFEQIECALNMGKLSVPFLMLLAGRDTVVDAQYCVGMFKKVKSEKKHIIYPESLHALTIERNREEVFEDIVRWICSVVKSFKT
jgi:alpha-beta hydrolase superfamily lysophospholipase